MRRGPGQDGADPGSRPVGDDAERLNCADALTSTVEQQRMNRPQ
ncbi:hypothetical protein [Micromonospora sp. NPDC005710]